jgi:lipopolysaccharide/colanic/teichoic acid biosynthesis glycosyltransferase
MKIYSILKRFIDVLVSLLVFICGIPIFILVGILIKLNSPGSIIFRQKRVGCNQKIFTFYKFRTMVKDAEKLKEKYKHLNQAVFPTFKIKNDPRLTKIGRFLRKTNLDELPNFINVLKGDMSIVGFRPPTPNEIKHYKKWHFKRFDGKPGITSLWVSDSYHKSTFDNWIKSDIYYNKNCSLKLDLLVIYNTFKMVVKSYKRYNRIKKPIE